MCITHGFVAALNVDDASRRIGAGTEFAEGPVPQEPAVKCAHSFD